VPSLPVSFRIAFTSGAAHVMMLDQRVDDVLRDAVTLGESAKPYPRSVGASDRFWGC